MSSASPDLTDDTMTALRESIATHGQLVPIVLWRGDVIDGRKRLACCEALGVEPITVTLADDVDATEHASALNLLRTHYNASQRSSYASRLATMKRGGDWRRDQTPNSEVGPLSIPQAAAMMGVSVASVAVARQVQRDGEPEVVAAVERGDLTLHAAERITKGIPRDRQAAVVRDITERTEGKRTAMARAFGHVTRSRPKPVTDVLTRLFDELENGTRILADYLDTPLPDAATQEDWAASLDRILPPLRRFRRRLTTGGRDE